MAFVEEIVVMEKETFSAMIDIPESEPGIPLNETRLQGVGRGRSGGGSGSWHYGNYGGIAGMQGAGGRMADRNVCPKLP